VPLVVERSHRRGRHDDSHRIDLGRDLLLKIHRQIALKITGMVPTRVGTQRITRRSGGATVHCSALTAVNRYLNRYKLASNTVKAYLASSSVFRATVGASSCER
jgi:hypothetical protein